MPTSVRRPAPSTASLGRPASGWRSGGGERARRSHRPAPHRLAASRSTDVQLTGHRTVGLAKPTVEQVPPERMHRPSISGRPSQPTDAPAPGGDREPEATRESGLPPQVFRPWHRTPGPGPYPDALPHSGAPSRPQADPRSEASGVDGTSEAMRPHRAAPTAPARSSETPKAALLASADCVGRKADSSNPPDTPSH